MTKLPKAPVDLALKSYMNIRKPQYHEEEVNLLEALT